MIAGHISFVKFVAYFASEILRAMLGVACALGATPSSECRRYCLNSLYRIANIEICFIKTILWWSFTATLHILFRYFGFGRPSTGIDAEDHAQYARARAAYKDEQSSRGH
ncbi:hypothetical protein BGX21_003255 [Mortierella sp. AD011]|nr:hypothetical protein BGX20_002713 [Mortierella sp. AD010]KAF9377214.1 hypothetical protein BGX21_003255 [Mortierella sp. AD011]